MNTIFEFIWAFVLATLTAMCLLAMTMMAMALFGYTPAMFAAEAAETSEASEAKNLEDVHAASCRVVCSKPNQNTGSIGTGTVIAHTKGRYWILTNWHVVAGFNTYKCQFTRDGRLVSVPARLEKSWHNESAPYDFAILTVDETLLAEYNPPIVPLAGSSGKPLTDRAIFSSGCSEGRWPMAWKGSVESYYGQTAQFYPAPKGGQSGSSIVQRLENGLRVTGILTWRVGDERSSGEEAMRGGAIPISHFYQAAYGRRPTSHDRQPSSIPPYSSWCMAGTAEDPQELSGEGDGKTEEPPIKTWPVQDAAAYFATSCAPDKAGLVLFFFSTPGCQPCLIAKPIIERLQAEGYPIRHVDAGDQEGREMARKCGVRMFPTFLLCRIEPDEYKGLEMWEGIDFLEQKIRQLFAKYAPKLPPAPKRKEKKEMADTPAAKTKEVIAPATNDDEKVNGILEAARRRSAPRSTPQPPTQGNGGTVPNIGRSGDGDSDDGNGGDNGSGDISPLLDVLPEDGQKGNEEQPAPQRKIAPTPKPKPKPTPKPDTGSTEVQQSRLIGSVADKLAARLETKFDAIADKVAATAETVVRDKIAEVTPEVKNMVRDKINEVSPEITQKAATWFQGVFWWAVATIVVLWYSITAVFACFSWAIRRIPVVTFQVRRRESQKEGG